MDNDALAVSTRRIISRERTFEIDSPSKPARKRRRSGDFWIEKDPLELID